MEENTDDWNSIYMEVSWHYKFNALTIDDIIKIKKAKNPRSTMYRFLADNYRKKWILK